MIFFSALSLFPQLDKMFRKFFWQEVSAIVHYFKANDCIFFI